MVSRTEDVLAKEGLLGEVGANRALVKMKEIYIKQTYCLKDCPLYNRLPIIWIICLPSMTLIHGICTNLDP